jgi:DNA (cytosine-5)-methyltransferase 1
LEKDGYMFVHPREDRTISVREAARMQSFPDSFDFSAGGEVAFTRQYRQIGNAVPPLLGLAIGQMVMHYLGNEPKMTLEATFGVKPRVLIGE